MKGAHRVSTSVPHHHRFCRNDTLCRQSMPEQLALVGSGAVKIRAIGLLKIRHEIKVLEDPIHVDFRLAGSDKESQVALQK